MSDSSTAEGQGVNSVKRDVLSLWLKLFLFAALLLAPTVIAIATQFRETVGFIADLGINQEVLSTIQLNLDILRELKPHVSGPDVGRLADAYERSNQTLEAYSAMFELKQPLLRELYLHTVTFGVVALVIGLALAWLLARNIVNIFRTLSQAAVEKERQQATLKSLEDWQAVSKTVIHELRSSLTPIKLLAGRSSLGGGDQDSEAIIMTEVGKIESLIDEMTHFARLPEPKKITADLGETILYVADHFEVEGVEIAVDRNDGRSKLMMFHDPAMIQRLLFNLIRNAGEANKGTLVRVSILSVVDGQNVLVHIRDNGRGIRQEHFSQVFVEGFSTKQSNLGIGLAVSKKIALDHGGDLSALPSDGGGYFVLILPYGAYAS